MVALVLALALLCSTIFDTVAVEGRPRSRLAVRLIHRGSIPALATIDDLESSMARLAQIETKHKGRAVSTPDDFRGTVVPGPQASVFLVNVSVGQPPVPQLVIIDTGSSMLWIQCVPCTGCPQQSTPTFDPSKSSSYVKGKCNNSYCTYPAPSKRCDSSGQCGFTIVYAGGTQVDGTIGFETLTFETSDEGTATVLEVLTGCAHEISDLNIPIGGILGLANREESIAPRLGAKFSYCIGDIRDPQYQYNQLTLGDDVLMEGDSTPFDDFAGFYYITLESIRVGDRKLDIDPEVFKRKQSGDGGMIIDSGTTCTFLIQDAYNRLRDAVQELIGGKLQPVADKSRLCYQGSVERDLSWFPVVTFYFAEGAELGLDIKSMFKDVETNKCCMAVVPTPPDEVGIIGVMAQQGYNVGYDIENYKIYFQRIDCRLLQS